MRVLGQTMQRGRSGSRSRSGSREGSRSQSCNYCKKPGHLIRDCRTLKWKIEHGLARDKNPPLFLPEGQSGSLSLSTVFMYLLLSPRMLEQVIFLLDFEERSGRNYL